MSEVKVFDLILNLMLLPLAQSGLSFAWGDSSESLEILLLKRVFILLPVLGIIVSYWAAVASLITVPFRGEKQAFLVSIFVTWWDFIQTVLSFWGGTFKFAYLFVVILLSFVKLLIVGLWVLLHDVIRIPLMVIQNTLVNFLSPGVAWIAVTMTLGWCLFEAMIFTFVMTPLSVDTLSNMTGGHLTETAVRAPLYIFMLFIILGSYAVLSTWAEAIRTRDVGTIVKIGAIEVVALSVEVVFLYREFVDALVPWFAAHSSGKFELGIAGTLIIAGGVWFGVRSLSWFLFASSGTPPIMAIIQGNGIQRRKESGTPMFKNSFMLTIGVINSVKKELDWSEEKGELLRDAFISPPLQVVGGAMNFWGLLISGQHLIELPRKYMKDLQAGKSLVDHVSTFLRRKG